MFANVTAFDTNNNLTFFPVRWLCSLVFLCRCFCCPTVEWQMVFTWCALFYSMANSKLPNRNVEHLHSNVRVHRQRVMCTMLNVSYHHFIFVIFYMLLSPLFILLANRINVGCEAISLLFFFVPCFFALQRKMFFSLLHCIVKMT